MPGFIDLQLNGAHGIDLTRQPERIDELAAQLPQHGVTAFVPTIVTCPPGPAAAPHWRRGAGGTAVETETGRPCRSGCTWRARCWRRSGAAPTPSRCSSRRRRQLVADWSRSSGVSLVTLAPELPGALDVIADAGRTRGVVVSLGHTDASAEQFAAGLAAGATYVTHLFNGMRPFGHRDPGPIGAALADDRVVAGVIADGIHVDPVAVRMAWRALGPRRFNLVTDAVAAAGRTERRAHPRRRAGRQRPDPRPGRPQPRRLDRVRRRGRRSPR